MEAVGDWLAVGCDEAAAACDDGEEEREGEGDEKMEVGMLRLYRGLTV